MARGCEIFLPDGDVSRETNTYDPLLHLLPEDLELLELQHSCVVHLVQSQGQSFALWELVRVKRVSRWRE